MIFYILLTIFVLLALIAFAIIGALLIKSVVDIYEI